MDANSTKYLFWFLTPIVINVNLTLLMLTLYYSRTNIFHENMNKIKPKLVIGLLGHHIYIYILYVCSPSRKTTT